MHRLQCRYLGIEFEQDDKEITLKVRCNCNPILDQSKDLPAQVAPSSKLIPPRPKDFPWHTIRTGYEADVENWITLQHMKELPFESSSKKRKIISDCNNDQVSHEHDKHTDSLASVINNRSLSPVNEHVSNVSLSKRDYKKKTLHQHHQEKNKNTGEGSPDW